ncbi:nitroreductase [uncultured Cohaesibacter sp.]|uniref:nitroreductase n=1 Tax=uncultured Cohaesibacter sp. TaxID=1002546 RepID=UPI0029C6C69B|nr:nitroreductase [uncultured Cohaesibacter sp.]
MKSSIQSLLQDRHSCRSFLDEVPPIEDLRSILRAARQAPSSANLQPGRFIVLTGDPLKQLCDSLALVADGPVEPLEYSYFPQAMPAELKRRQQAAGYALYSALGIERRDIAGRRAQFSRNYHFFHAPVGIVVTLRKELGSGCFMDLGMTIMALMLKAQSMGYGSCAIGAIANHGRTVHRHLGLPEEELVVCGIALGKPNISDPVNRFRTQRAEIEDYCEFHGFGMDGDA